MTLVKNNELLNLNIEDNSIIVTNYYNKKKKFLIPVFY